MDNVEETFQLTYDDAVEFIKHVATEVAETMHWSLSRCQPKPDEPGFYIVHEKDVRGENGMALIIGAWTQCGFPGGTFYVQGVYPCYGVDRLFRMVKLPILYFEAETATVKQIYDGVTGMMAQYIKALRISQTLLHTPVTYTECRRTVETVTRRSTPVYRMDDVEDTPIVDTNKSIKDTFESINDALHAALRNPQ